MGLSTASFSPRGSIGDTKFPIAETFWSGFGILLRKHRLDPLLASAIIAVSALVTFVPVYLGRRAARGFWR